MALDKEQIKKYYPLLPKEVKAVFDDPDTSDKIYDICEKYGVKHLDQMGAIDSALYGMILGLLKPADFVPTIIRETGIGEDIANLITHDINEQILRLIREQLMAHHQTLAADPAGQGAADAGQTGHDLTNNAERTSAGIGFSSAPYAPVTKNKAQDEAIAEIENPAPANIITRDIFAERGSGVVSSNKTAEKIELIAPPTPTTTKEANDDKPKTDPYREALE